MQHVKVPISSAVKYTSPARRIIPVLLHVIVLQPHQLQKAHTFFPKRLYLSHMVFVYIFFIFYKLYRKYLKMYDKVNWQECLCQNLLTNIWGRNAALERNYFSRCNNFVSTALLSLLLSDFGPNRCRNSLLRGKLPISSKSHMSFSVSIPCFNKNDSEWALKMQSEIY